MPAAVGPVLAVNVGSSSLKLSVLDENDRILAELSGDFGGETVELEAHCEEMLDRHHTYVREHLQDMPEVRDWTWGT